MLNRGLDKQELLRIVDSVANEKSIDKELILSSMESAIQKAAYSKYGFDTEIEAKIDRKSFYRLLDLAEYSKLEGKEWLGIYSDSIFFPIILKEKLDKDLI